MASGGGSKQSSQTQFITDILEPILSQAETRGILGQAGGIATGAAESPFLQAIQGSILDPQPLELDPLNQAFAESAISQFGGNRALRNLGAPTNQQVIQQSLPFFQQQRQQNLGNLFGGQQAQMGTTNLILQTLLDIAGLGAPQVVAGQEGRSRGSQFQAGIGF